MENEEGSMLGDVVGGDGTLMLQLLMKGSEELIKFKKDSPALAYAIPLTSIHSNSDLT